MNDTIKITCPDLSLSLGFCPDCYQNNVKTISAYLTCYCECNRVGAFAEIIKAKDNGVERARLGSWKMRMEVSREEFERNLEKQGNGISIPVEIIFKA
jgi:hypothetical protein